MTDFITGEKSNGEFGSAHFFGRTVERAKPLILIIESDAETRFMFRMLLETWNYRVVESKGAPDNIGAFGELRPDLILMDIALQYMKSLSSFRRLRKIAALDGTPTVFYSGHSHPAFRDMALACGGSDLLVEPVDFDRLKELIRQICRRTLRRQ